MIREIYLRDSTDSRYNEKTLEIDDDKEVLLNKIRMILYSNRGEVLGAPELGMDLDSYIFDYSIPEDIIRNRFYAQIAKYITETKQFKIDFELDVISNGVTKTANIYITINGNTELALNLSNE